MCGERGGMSEEPAKVQIRWLDLCEKGAPHFALASLLMGALAGVPNLPSGDDDLFKQAAERAARVVMQEIGRRAFEGAMDVAEALWSEVVEEAKVQAGARQSSLPLDAK